MSSQSPYGLGKMTTQHWQVSGVTAHLVSAPCGGGKGKRAQVLNIHMRKVEERVVVKRLQICKQCKSNTVFNTTHFFIMEPNLYGFLLSHAAHPIF